MQEKEFSGEEILRKKFQTSGIKVKKKSLTIYLII
jgi:hypothetical protein